KRYQTEYSRAYPFGDGFDRASFAGAVAAFEHDDYSQSLMLHPLLECAELRLKAEQLFFVFFPLQLGVDLGHELSILHHLYLSEAPRADGEQDDCKKGKGDQIRPQRAPRRIL